MSLVIRFLSCTKSRTAEDTMTIFLMQNIQPYSYPVVRAPNLLCVVSGWNAATASHPKLRFRCHIHVTTVVLVNRPLLNQSFIFWRVSLCGYGRYLDLHYSQRCATTVTFPGLQNTILSVIQCHIQHVRFKPPSYRNLVVKTNDQLRVIWASVLTIGCFSTVFSLILRDSWKPVTVGLEPWCSSVAVPELMPVSIALSD